MKRAALALLLLGCSSEPKQTPPREWRVIAELDRVALTVHVAAPGDVWIGGGGLGTGPGALVLHGSAEVDTGRAETIWWISGSAPDDLWFVGERGLALHRVGERFTATDTGTTATLFGVWASARDDAWAVGGSPNGAGPNDVLLHWDGSAWSAITSPTRGASLFKVWGRARDDVYAVGTGVALHYDGKTWSELPMTTKTSLFTVHGDRDATFAVGGGPATLLRMPSCQTVELPETASGILSGVAVGPTVFVVGERKQRYRIESSVVHDDSSSLTLPGIDLHGVALDGGDAIAVGGNYMALMRPGAKARGVVLRYGSP